MRPIDGDALSEWLKDYVQKFIKGEREISLMYIWKRVKDMPTIELEREKGRWIKISPARIYECSRCGKNVMTDDITAYDFCHGCGADMRETWK